MSEEELSKINKKDIISAIIKSRVSQPSGPDAPAIQAALLLVKPLLIECNKALQEEIHELRLQVASLQDKLKQCMHQPHEHENEANCNRSSISFAEAVRKTMKDTLNDQGTKAEVIIAGVKDEGKDIEFMTDLCEKMKQSCKPKQGTRIGHKKPGKNRLIKVRFHSEFDARTFRVHYDEIKENKDLPLVRMRPSRTKEGQDEYNKMKEMNKKLNENAKKENANCSFSLRDDCTIWKFVQNEGRWKHDKSWKLPSDLPEVGITSAVPNQGN